MIIKFLSRKSNSGQLIKYALKYILNREKSDIEGIRENVNGMGPSFLIKHNLRSRTIKGLIQEFAENESFRLVRRKDSVQAFHTIISFGAADKSLITDNILKDVAQKFINERGSNSLFIVGKHLEKEHVHLHLVSSGTQLNGRSARISNQKFRSIKLNLDKYQRSKYPFLVNSLPNYEKEKIINKGTLIAHFKMNRQTTKAAITEKLETAYSTSKSLVEFQEKIKLAGLETYSRNGKLQGILYEGKTKCRFTRLGFSFDRLLELDHDPKQENSYPKKSLQQEHEPAMRKEQIEELEKLKAMRAKNEERELTNELVLTQDLQRGDDFDQMTMDENENLFPRTRMRFLPRPLKEEA